MEKRVFIAFALSLAVLFIFQYYFQVKFQKTTSPVVEKKSTVTMPEETEPKGPSLKKTEKVLKGKKVIVETDLYRAVIDTSGGKITSLGLKDYTRRKKPPFQKEDEQFLETIPKGEFYPLETTGEQLIYQADREILSLTPKEPTGTLLLQGERPGRKIIKRFTFDNRRYGIGLEIEFEGEGQDTEIFLIGFGAKPPEVRMQTPEQISVVKDEGIERFRPERIKEEERHITNATCLTKISQYLISFLKPERGLTALISREKETGLIASYLLTPEKASIYRFYYYSGPADYSIIAKEQVGVERALPSGPMVILGRFILKILTFFHRIIPNWGVAIIFMTILVKILFFPLTRLSLRTMKTMQKLQPYLKDLSKKYKGNPQGMQKELFGLYRQYRINPMAGCLPMLVQIPIFIAIFIMLRTAIVLRGAPFALWISDLSLPDALFALKIAGRDFPVNLLPLFMGATMFLQQKLSSVATSPGSEQQKVMAFFMPAMLVIFLYNLPSGLMLYWTVTNLFSLLEQEVATHHIR